MVSGDSFCGGGSLRLRLLDSSKTTSEAFFLRGAKKGLMGLLVPVVVVDFGLEDAVRGLKKACCGCLVCEVGFVLAGFAFGLDCC